MPTALITGPTSGIGNVFAHRLAATGWDLVLVARDSERLGRVADELGAAHGRAIEVIPADLGDAAARAHIAERLAESERPVELLVNNAGYAVGHRFLDNEFAAEDASLAVLVRAVMQLSHAAANAMRERGHGGIINVSSVAGFLPRGSYAAAKAWVTSFSRSLAGELEGSGVRVVATCPGFTRTEFHARGGFNTDDIPDFLWLSAEHVVDDALDALRKGKVVTIPGLQWKAIVTAARYLPVSAIGMATRQIGRRAPSPTSASDCSST